MARRPARRPDDRESEPPAGYWWTARRPLQVLVFLLPLVVAYEVCLALLLRTGDGRGVHTVLAHKGLLAFFDAFGVAESRGLYLGGLVIVAVLLAWHVLARERWRIDLPALGLMAAESLILALPLLLVGRLAVAGIALAAGRTDIADLGLRSQIAISVGAGLYEELAFRMVLIAAAHTLLVDLAGMPSRAGAAIAIVVSAIAFTLYHDLTLDDGSLSWRRVFFYAVAGLYFGVVFSLRGFGIVVGTHAVYDAITVLLAGGDS
jgi:hypothetical protein